MKKTDEEWEAAARTIAVTHGKTLEEVKATGEHLRNLNEFIKPIKKYIAYDIDQMTDKCAAASVACLNIIVGFDERTQLFIIESMLQSLFKDPDRKSMAIYDEFLKEIKGDKNRKINDEQQRNARQ